MKTKLSLPSKTRSLDSQPAPLASVDAPRRFARALWGVGLVSAAALAFEIALARICAALLQYHLSFAVVSLAVLGVGLGGFAAVVLVQRGTRSETVADAALVGIAPAMLVALVALLILPFARFWPIGIFMILPAFACAGAFQALMLRSLPEMAARLYAADLLGGALGALLAVAALSALGGPVNATLIFALATSGIALLWTGARGRTGRLAVATGCAALALVVVQRTTSWLDVRWEHSPNKLLTRTLRPTPVGTPRLLPRLAHWDAYSRVDVTRLDSPRGVQCLVFIDGETPTPMLPANPLAPNAAGVELEATLAALPFRMRRPADVLAIGTGGGHDVVLARRFGATRVDAVEFNPGVLAVVERSRDFTGGVYDQPGVQLHHAEGRLFARQAPAARWDLVNLALAQSLAGNLQEYALSENYLYTREAFEAYFRVLRPGGMLALLTSDPTVQRKLLLSAIAVLDSHGLQGGRCTTAVSSPKEVPYNHLVLVRTAPFESGDLEFLNAEIAARGYEVLHRPGDAAPPASERMQVATDDRPFFFHLERGTPFGLRLLLGIAAMLLLAAWIGLLMPAVRGGTQAVTAAGAGAYFVFLGLGFLMVEVLALQLTLRVVGFPALNLALVLATFLVGAGCGSAVSARIRTRRTLRILLVGLGVALVFFVPWLNTVLGAVEKASLARRCAAVCLALLPFAFVMGMPLPSGIRLLPKSAHAAIPWLWGLNGVASIAGSASIVALVLEVGLRRGSVIPAAAYLLAAAATLIFARRIEDSMDGRGTGDRAAV